ncbi:MAG: prepilin-type N-terminal cleavage/methylation domain-containing protein [Pseudomonadota bacterium]|nr:prepilin-type N-terminal cleavage/methylation domain-containing protein [Pseudomonadota bacterium]
MAAKSNSGLTIVELMVVLAILATLVVLATPLYNATVARSRMGEAKVNLNTIASLQENYLLDYSKYFGSLSVGASGCADNDLGFLPKNCSTMRYHFTTSGGSRNFTATANAPASKKVYPHCAKPDQWQYVKNDRFCSAATSCRPVHTVNVLKACEL